MLALNAKKNLTPSPQNSECQLPATLTELEPSATAGWSALGSRPPPAETTKALQQPTRTGIQDNYETRQARICVVHVQQVLQTMVLASFGWGQASRLTLHESVQRAATRGRTWGLPQQISSVRKYTPRDAGCTAGTTETTCWSRCCATAELRFSERSRLMWGHFTGEVVLGSRALIIGKKSAVKTQRKQRDFNMCLFLGLKSL